jgi:hypothetical protein
MGDATQMAKMAFKVSFLANVASSIKGRGFATTHHLVKLLGSSSGLIGSVLR